MTSLRELFKAFVYKDYTPKGEVMSFTSMDDISKMLKRFSGFGDVSDKALVEKLNTIPDLFAITDFTTSQISNLPVKIVNKKGDDTTNEALSELIRQPNYYQNWPALIKQFAAYYEILGNSYMYAMRPLGVRKLESLFVLPAQYMKIVFENAKTQPNFLNNIVGYEFELNGKITRFEADEILHKKYINLRYENGQWAYGISKYIPADKITTDLKAIYDARTSIIDSRGALGFISNETDVPDAELSSQAQENLNKNYGLKAGQNKFMVTTQRLTWQQIALGIGELQLIENANYDFNKLCQLNGFDPVIFSTDGSTFANKKEAIKMFISAVLVPKVNDLYTDLNEKISMYFGGDMIVPDWSKVPELKEDQERLNKMLMDQIRHGVTTPYFAHEKLHGITNHMPEDKYYIMNTINNENKANGQGN